ncbi:MAG: DUF22 domain-containing protein [Archaeoglobales archaeon]|nr:DUF22 domain-containing protein [Archaeoglobales archaeon]
MEILYWKELGKETVSLKVKKETVRYRLAPFVQWKVLIAENTTEVKKGLPVVLKIKDVEIPENTILAPLSIMRHALGTTLDVIEKGISKVENEKKITHAIFLPVEDGIVEEGDIVGVLKVFFVKTGMLDRRFGFSASDIKIREDMVSANLVYKEGGELKREKIKTRFFGYFKSYIAEWEPVVSAENIDVKKGEVERIKIKEIVLQPNTVVSPLHIMRNTFGSVVEVAQEGKPSKVEEEKKIVDAIFLAERDGKIQKGDLLGVLNVYYTAIGNFEPKMNPKEEKFARIVYEKSGRIFRNGMILKPFAYRRKPIARWEPIVANEDLAVKKGKLAEIEIEPVKLEENTILYPLYIMRHAYGTIVDLIEKEPAKVENPKIIRKVLFLPVFDGEIKRGQLIGVVNVYNVEIESYEILGKWLSEWVEEMKRALGEVT